MSNYKVIYKPKGKAGEYCDGYAANLYRGCGHKCTYCYAPRVLHMKSDEFFNDPKPRKDILENHFADIDKMVAEGDIQEVFLCFTCDPLQPIEGTEEITERAIRHMEKMGVPYRILTKAGYQQAKDYLLYFMSPDLATIGSTLVFCKDKHSERFEPGAPVTSDRLNLLWQAHRLKFKTWVSLEPVWTPTDAIALIKRTHEFVDEFRIGKLNYHPQSKNVDWVKFAREISDFCDDLGVKYTLKEDLRRLL